MRTGIRKISILAFVFALCVTCGLYFVSSTQKQASASTTTNVSNSAAYTWEGFASNSYGGQSYQYWQIKLTFNGVSDPAPKGGPKDGYNVNGAATTYTTMDLMEYIVIDEINPTGKNPDYMGKSAREICNANAAGNLDKSYGAPTTGGGGNIYGPIRVNIGSYGVRIRCCEDFVARDNLKIILKSGYSYEVDNDTVLTWTCDVVFRWSDSTFVEYIQEEQDATDKVDLIYKGESGGVYEVDFTLDGITNVYPSNATSAVWANDNGSTNKFKVDPMAYIKIGANTARAIVAGNASANVYKGLGGLPMSWGGQYAPIGVLFDGNGIIRIKIYSSYCAYSNLSITIMSGLKLLTTVGNDKIIYAINSDVTYSYDSGVFVKTTAEKINVDGIANFALISTNNNTPASDGTYSKITLTFDGVTRVMSKGAVGTDGSGGFWVNDNAVNYTYGVDLMNYLYINGVSARSVVGTSGTGLVNALATFGPVAVCVWPTSIEIRVRNSYINYEDLYITLKSGWGLLTDDGKMLKTTQDCTYRHYVDGVGNHSYEYATDFIDLSETTVHFENLVKADKTYNGASATRFQFWFDGVNQITHKKSNGDFCVNDHATDKTDGVDLMQYIYVNGVSARSIVNDNIAGNLDKTYVGLADGSSTTTFGPICVYMFSGKHFQIRIDDSYLDYDDIFLTIKAGLVWWTADNKVLTVSEDMTFCFKKSASWTEEDHYCDTYKVEDLIAADTFDMQKGAGVRTAVAAGIRFTAQYAEDEFDYWTNHAGCTVEVGMLLTKESIIGGDALTIASVSANKAVKLVCSNNSDTAKDGYYLFHGGISPMSSTASYSVNYVGRAYMKITVNGNEYYKYATVNDNVRSIVTVATLAIESGTLSPAEETFLQGIIDAAA